jgi:hypothetical protein
MEKTNHMRMVEKKRYAVLFSFIIVISIYYALTIPSNSIWSDQISAVNIAKDILNGNFPLVGYAHSNRMLSFPAFYYFIAPLVYISDDPIFLYWSVAVMNILGVMIVTKYIYSKYGFQEYVIFLLFSATHVSTLFFSSFFWNPNYIPFFMSIFLISLLKYLNNKNSIIFFHIAGIVINLMVQMLPQTIVLIPAFIIILFLFKKIPSLLNQAVHVIIQIALVYPWIHYHLFVFEWGGFESGQKLYKGFSISIVEYLNYLGGWVLNSEYTTYLAYGTNTYPYAEFIDILLTGSSFLLLSLLVYSTWISCKGIKIKNFINITIIDNDKSELTTQQILIVLAVINFSCIIYFLTGMQMVSYHYQFLAPVLSLNMCLLISYEKKYKKILLSLLVLLILFQGSFSYWRAYSEYTKPYVTDIGYSDKFAQFLTNNCNAESSAYVLDPQGLHYFKSSNGSADKNACDKVVLVMRDHYAQSEIIRWVLEENYRKTEMVFKDYMIWSATKDLP